MIKSGQIRTSFIDFFKKNDHEHLPSSQLIPTSDPSLLFTNAGMVQFKNWFTGDEDAKFKSVVTYQKCLRAGGKHNDLDNVGFTPRHHTFFEMLGNFSFGSYFKEKAIYLAWNYLISELKLDKNKIYITTYKDDEESFNYWKKITGFSESRLIRISSNDNFWSMGESGPCGPCSEIFFDQGEKIFGGLPGSKNQDGPRFIEIWNLVFMELNKKKENLELLPQKCVDTGMGLERIVAVVNGLKNNFETDCFSGLINFISKKTNTEVQNNNIHSFRIIADHIRSIVFILSEGILPSNEGRGYVLRRIIRRAARQLSELNYEEILLCELVKEVCNNFRGTYSDIERDEEFISETLKKEEINFSKTIFEGNKLLLEEIKKCKTKKFPEDLVFKLFDTYGFPVDLTNNILSRKKLKYDSEKLNQIFKNQKLLSKTTWMGSGETESNKFFLKIKEKFKSTKFLGYEKFKSESKLLAIISEEKFVKNIDEDKTYYAIFCSTPFYAESGGQVGDKGYVKIKNDTVCEILDTQKIEGGIFLHKIKSIGSKKLVINKNYSLVIDHCRRQKISNNHSATHLLHESLRQVIGKYVKQKGSLVTDEKLRFDFTSPRSLNQNEINQVEKNVNQSIRKNFKIKIFNLPLQKALDIGAIGLFGEKYPEIVRVVHMTNNHGFKDFFSSELCGGSHSDCTGEIGSFKILNETSISSGVRRVEAITGEKVESYIREKENLFNKLKILLKTDEKTIYEKISNLKNEISKVKNNSSNTFDKLIDKMCLKRIGQKTLYSQSIELNSKDVKPYNDYVKNVLNPDVVFLVYKKKSKVSFLVNLKNKTESKKNAIEIVNILVPIIGGKGGGGRDDMAQGGGPDISKVDSLFKRIEDLI